jgi:hypothetical protein
MQDAQSGQLIFSIFTHQLNLERTLLYCKVNF